VGCLFITAIAFFLHIQKFVIFNKSILFAIRNMANIQAASEILHKAAEALDVLWSCTRCSKLFCVADNARLPCVFHPGSEIDLKAYTGDLCVRECCMGVTKRTFLMPEYLICHGCTRCAHRCEQDLHSGLTALVPILASECRKRGICKSSAGAGPVVFSPGCVVLGQATTVADLDKKFEVVVNGGDITKCSINECPCSWCTKVKKYMCDYHDAASTQVDKEDDEESYGQTLALQRKHNTDRCRAFCPEERQSENITESTFYVLSGFDPKPCYSVVENNCRMLTNFYGDNAKVMRKLYDFYFSRSGYDDVSRILSEGIRRQTRVKFL
jgi:hypothetical protein